MTKVEEVVKVKTDDARVMVKEISQVEYDASFDFNRLDELVNNMVQHSKGHSSREKSVEQSGQTNPRENQYSPRRIQGEK